MLRNKVIEKTVLKMDLRVGVSFLEVCWYRRYSIKSCIRLAFFYWSEVKVSHIKWSWQVTWFWIKFDKAYESELESTEPCWYSYIPFRSSCCIQRFRPKSHGLYVLDLPKKWSLYVNVLNCTVYFYSSIRIRNYDF